MESGRARRGGKKAAEQKATKQPQRGLGVAQLEKIRLHNQMMAAYRVSGMQPHQDVRMQVPFAAPTAAPMAGGASSFLPHHTDCGFEATDRGIIGGVKYYDRLLPYSSSSPPPATLLAHHVRDSSDQRPLGQPTQQHYWLSSSSDGGNAEELDLELRL